MTTRQLALARLRAWIIDWLHILVVPVLMVVLGLVLAWVGIEPSPTGWNVIGFFTMVTPVTIWLAIRESGSESTPGKRRRHLEVVDAESGRPPTFGRALIRNVGKVAIPWQLGHSVAFGFATLGDATPGTGLIITSIVCYALIFAHLGALFLGRGRTLYDLIAGTLVEARRR